MASAMVIITYLQDEIIKKGNALLMFFSETLEYA